MAMDKKIKGDWPGGLESKMGELLDYFCSRLSYRGASIWCEDNKGRPFRRDIPPVRITREKFDFLRVIDEGVTLDDLTGVAAPGATLEWRHKKTGRIALQYVSSPKQDMANWSAYEDTLRASEAADPWA